MSLLTCAFEESKQFLSIASVAGEKNPNVNIAKMKVKGAVGYSAHLMVILCGASFILGLLFSSRFPSVSSTKGIGHTLDEKDVIHPHEKDVNHDHELRTVTEIQCEPKTKPVIGDSSSTDILGEVSKTHKAIRTLDKTISSLEMELAATRAAHASKSSGAPLYKPVGEFVEVRQKAFVVVGINTAFSSRKRRDSVRQTWTPTGAKLKTLEQEKGIVVRFVIGHSATPGGILDRAIEAEDAQYKDFLRLDHVEGYHELSAKTKVYFATAVSKWDADFYMKVDDDVHVNLGMLATTLARHQSKPRVYIGCMKSGPVLAQKGEKYHEPEYWKFGEEGNKYFRHATGQIYGISKDLAIYISINQPILHRYANEDVSLGAWFIGLDVEHIDDRSFCCGTPPDCEWKAQAGNVCVASFDWTCSGICKSVERIKDVHQRCGEGDDASWSAIF